MDNAFFQVSLVKYVPESTQTTRSSPVKENFLIKHKLAHIVTTPLLISVEILYIKQIWNPTIGISTSLDLPKNKPKPKTSYLVQN